MDDIPTLAMDILEQVQATLGMNDSSNNFHSLHPPRRASWLNGALYPPGMSYPGAQALADRHISYKDPITGAKINYGACGERSAR